LKIGFVGAGNVGTGLGKRLAAAGHEIILSFARTPDKLAAAAAAVGRTARSGTPETAAGEEIARAAPGAMVVKAVLPFAELLHSDSLLIERRRPAVFVCSDDRSARLTLPSLLADIGIDGIDSGPLKRARFTEPLGMLVTNLAYVEGMGARINAVLIRDPSA